MPSIPTETSRISGMYQGEVNGGLDTMLACPQLNFNQLMQQNFDAGEQDFELALGHEQKSARDDSSSSNLSLTLDAQQHNHTSSLQLNYRNYQGKGPTPQRPTNNFSTHTLNNELAKSEQKRRKDVTQDTLLQKAHSSENITISIPALK